MSATKDDLAQFESHRPDLLALAYRMLGDVERAEDMVQDAWLRWSQRGGQDVTNPRAYLATTVTRLCLNELASARARYEADRADRLPEPIDSSSGTLDRLALLDDLSLAFLVALQRLTAAERATLILHDVFHFRHEEVGQLLGKTAASSRQLLRRARVQVHQERRAFDATDEEHSRLLEAFVDAARTGNTKGIAKLLTEDVMLIADAGPHGGRFGRVRNLAGPLAGRTKVAAFAGAVTPQGADGLDVLERRFNGRPALLVIRHGAPYAILAIAVTDRLISRIYVQSDPHKLRRLAIS